jgi:hypothetical protein
MADGQVIYGLTTAYNGSTTYNGTLNNSHIAFLGGLLPNTTYHFQIRSNNASNTLSTLATSSDMTFMTASSTASTTPPIATTTPPVATTTMPVQVMIMKHLCNANIKSLQDFQNLGTGKDPVATLAADVLACPTTGLVGNAAVAGTVASPRSAYNFTVQSNGKTKTLSADGTYMPHKVCESDLNLDVDGNGTISSTTCLDISHYQIPIMASGTPITVTESMSPSGFHFGTLRFTPVALDGNNDASSLTNLDSANGVITLNPVGDTDGMIMLHVYNFPNQSSTTATTTPPVITPPAGTGSSTLDMLQDQINALKIRVSALESFIMGLGGIGGGTSTPPTIGTGKIDQSNMTVTPSHAIDFSGRSFGHEESVSVMLNGITVTTAHADGGGNFSTGSFAAPSTVGNYTYQFKGMTSGITASAMITVQ